MGIGATGQIREAKGKSDESVLLFRAVRKVLWQGEIRAGVCLEHSGKRHHKWRSVESRRAGAEEGWWVG